MAVVSTTDLKSGIVTEKVFEQEPNGYRVVWIEWDSDFRNTDLQIGDLIVGVDGKKYENIKDGNVSPLAVGQYLESTTWERLGAKDGQEIVLEVIRLQEKPILQIKGKLRYEKIYSQQDGKRSLSRDGPPTLSNDGFANAWSTWYENFTKKTSYLLDFVWERWGTFVSSRELSELQELKPRIDYLINTYPGAFAESVLSDWKKVIEYVTGPKIDPDSVNLEYRGIAAERIQKVKAAAAKAYEAFVKELSADLTEPFPAKDVDSRAQVVGKVVELPWLTFRNFINDLGRSYAVAGSSRDGFYFADINSAQLDAFFGTWFRYKAGVNSNIAERYRLVGRILDDPRLLTYQQQPAKGLMVQPLGALAGDEELFVDLRAIETSRDVAAFAGESLLSGDTKVNLADDALPGQVIETMITAVKYADELSWKKLFANWRVYTRGGVVLVDSTHTESATVLQRDWEFSRKLISTKVYGARINRVTPVRVLAQGTPDGKNPRVEQAIVYIFHIGLFEGRYVAFSDIDVQRLWKLQRINGGPWGIVESQHL